MRKTGPRQLSFVFADSPSGDGKAERSDASEPRSFLLQKAKRKTTIGSDAGAADASRLLEAAANEANLARALLNVVRNKGAPGVDGQTVEAAEAQAPALIARLRRDLLEGRYRPGDVRRVWLPKPGGGQRGLGIPNVVDRVVQQALLQVLEPIFEPTFHASNHGFRPRRGAHTAIAEATGYLKDGYRTVVDLDLAKFFDRVHHQRLLARLAQRVPDQADTRPGSPDAEGGRGDAGRDEGRGPGRNASRAVRSRHCFPTSCSTNWTANWRGGACGSFATPMIATSS